MRLDEFQGFRHIGGTAYAVQHIVEPQLQEPQRIAVDFRALPGVILRFSGRRHGEGDPAAGPFDPYGPGADAGSQFSDQDPVRQVK